MFGIFVFFENEFSLNTIEMIKGSGQAGYEKWFSKSLIKFFIKFSNQYNI